MHTTSIPSLHKPWEDGMYWVHCWVHVCRRLGHEARMAITERAASTCCRRGTRQVPAERTSPDPVGRDSWPCDAYRGSQRTCGGIGQPLRPELKMQPFVFCLPFSVDVPGTW